MPKFRKKPVVIEAVQFLLNRKAIKEVAEFMQGKPVDLPNRMAEDYWDDYVAGIIKSRRLELKTLESAEGLQVAEHGDWIIKGVHGEFYPCKPDIFEKTYESPQPNDALWKEVVDIIDDMYEVGGEDGCNDDIYRYLSEQYTISRQ